MRGLAFLFFLGVALVARPAAAQIKLGLGGYYSAYALYAANDMGPGPVEELHPFDFKRDAEIHFSGSAPIADNLIAGVHAELRLGNEGDPIAGPGGNTPYQMPVVCCLVVPNDASTLDQAYLHFSGSWGRFNFGSADGVAYLLQVAAPSADPNVDGMRVRVQGFAAQQWRGIGNASIAGTGYQSGDVLGYDNANFRNAEKITYLTPRLNGFQGGVTYIPSGFQQKVDESSAGMPFSDRLAGFRDIVEVAGRWDGNIGDWDVGMGLGYSRGLPSTRVLAGAAQGSDYLETFDAGLHGQRGELSLGVAAKITNTGVCECPGTGSPNIYTVVGGIAWDRGPLHLGATYANFNFNSAFSGATVRPNVSNAHLARVVVGGGYDFAPGVSARASLGYLDVKNAENILAADQQFQMVLGTQINF